MTIKTRTGPNDVEQQMLELVYTRFSEVLERDPAKAARLASELADVSARYVAPEPTAQTRNA